MEVVNASQQVRIAANANAVREATTRLSAVETTNSIQQTAIEGLQNGLASETNARIAADAALGGRISDLEAIAFDLSRNLGNLEKKIAGSTAVAVAMSGNSFLPGQTVNVTGNLATYDGAYAGALQIGVLVTPNVALNAGIATGFDRGGGATAARAGFTFGW